MPSGGFSICVGSQRTSVARRRRRRLQHVNPHSIVKHTVRAFFFAVLLLLGTTLLLEEVAGTSSASSNTCDHTTQECLAAFEQNTMPPQHKVIVTGASGSVGRRVVYYALKHKSVDSVTALLRSGPEKDAAFFGLDLANPTDRDVFETKLKQKIVKYNAPEEVAEASKGHTAGISCLGVYTADVKDLEDFMQKEYEPNLAVARAAAATGAKRWGYLSGQGVKQSDRSTKKPGLFEPIFSFAKGSIERDLSSIEGFEATTSARPGMILNRSNSYGGFMGYLETHANNWKWLANSRFAVQTDDIAKALVHSVVKSDHLVLNEVLENEDIKRTAREFEAAV